MTCRRLMRRVRLGFVFIAIVASPALGLGQWLHYPTADVPRKSDGTSESDCAHAAAARRQARLLRLLARGKSATAACPAQADSSRAVSRSVGRRSAAISARISLAACRINRGGRDRQAATADDSRDDPHVRCLPDNPPRTWAAAPDEVDAHAEAAGAALRGERDVPADLHRRTSAARGSQPGWNGYSTARWDGDTLVVKTAGFRDDTWMDTWRQPDERCRDDDRAHPPAELTARSRSSDH